MEKEKDKEKETVTFVEPEERDYRKEILEIIRGDYTEEELKEKLEIKIFLKYFFLLI